ncbi:uncharacterized protein LOC119315786 [Triticum dicoccoides]|uniref:uncharacterized protein LOC119315786 n=1 Tax=Triticum dicoccoides TaxID=85692 RepID=UPI001891D5FF|nr:uncharacterized protein LOC119315786 [Triticum dicoccoides]
MPAADTHNARWNEKPEKWNGEHQHHGAADRPSETAALRALVDRVYRGEVEAAREVRRLTWASARHRRKLAAAVEPLVAMLRSGAPWLLTLLNLAVRDEREILKPRTTDLADVSARC